MADRKIRVLGVNITNRVKQAKELQELFSEYGCYIKTRIGLHTVTDEFCSTSGLVILELFGEENKQKELEQKIRSFEGVEVEKMVFN